MSRILKDENASLTDYCSSARSGDGEDGDGGSYGPGVLENSSSSRRSPLDAVFDAAEFGRFHGGSLTRARQSAQYQMELRAKQEAANNSVDESDGAGSLTADSLQK